MGNKSQTNSAYIKKPIYNTKEWTLKKQITSPPAFRHMRCSIIMWQKLWQYKSQEDLHLCELSWVRLNSEWEESLEVSSLSSACLALGSLLKQLWEWDAVYLGYFPEKYAE